MALVVALALTVAAFIYVVYPLYRGRIQRAVPESPELKELAARRDAIYASIKELQFDKELGNLSDQDYQELAEKYKHKAASVLKELDATGERAPLEKRLEKEIRAVRQTRKVAGASFTCRHCGHEERAGARFCSQCGQPLALLCPRCETPYTPEDRFCASCGASLPREKKR